MLIQGSFPSYIDAGLSSVSDHAQQEFSYVWISGDGTWKECPKRDRHPQGDSEKPVLVYERKNRNDNSCSPNFLRHSKLSTVTAMSENSSPTFVYKRRKIRSSSTNTRPSDNCHSASSSEAFSVSAKEHIVSLVDINNGAILAPDVLLDKCSGPNVASNSGSVDRGSLGPEPANEEDPISDMQKGLDSCGLNDRCSSSKSNVDDIGECSSSGAPITEGLREDLSVKDLCISLLRSHGVLKRVLPIKACASAEHMGVRSNSSCFRSCKICDELETTLNMLICDHCEESFHVSCCNPRITKLPVDEWFCHSCLRKKLSKLKEASSSECNSGRRKTVISKDESGPIAFMLSDTEPYTTNVRIGKDFQAEVPDWSGPLADEVDYISEPVEMNPSECASYQDWNSCKPSRLSSIGNWLQCRGVIDGVGEGVDGTVCGKWRRAPLFEVQTDDWECFSSVLWDPTHADCAVPQELDTDQVLKDLKYIEMLRPRLAGKRCKLGVTEGVDSRELNDDLRNTRTR